MEDKIQVYRQPLVTATGIILGFLLNFATSWVKTDTPIPDSLSYVVFVCSLAGIISLITVLARVLRMDYPRDKAEEYYTKTLRLFIFGVSTAFTGVLIDMFSNFLSA